MNEKKIEFTSDAQDKMASGVDKLYNAVKCTLGPMGKNVMIRRSAVANAHITKDGATVVRDIILSDPTEDISVQVVKEAAMKTAEKAGDGTTTSTIIAANIIKRGIQEIKSGANSVYVKQGIEKATRIATDYIVSRAKKIDANAVEIENIGTISANNDREIGKLIAEGMSKVKSDGTIAVELSKTGITSIEVVEGMRIDRGYVSPYFVTDPEKNQAVMDSPFILCADMSFNNMNEIVPLLEQVAKTNSSIVIVANEIEGDALSAMVLNKVKGALKVVAVKAPSYGDMRKEILTDIATVCGGTVASYDAGIDLGSVTLGKAAKVIVTNDSMTIIDSAGKQENIQARIAQTRSVVDSAKTEHEKNQHMQRLARLVGGVAVLYVGAPTEIEMREKRDRIDDALHATRAALEEGIVPGGGMIYAQAADEIKKYIVENPDLKDELIGGMKIVISALRKPFEIILENAGLHADIVSHKIYEGGFNNFGYDVKNDKYGDMLEMGVVDPVKVARIAVEIASSIACTLITTECVIVPEKLEAPTTHGR